MTADPVDPLDAAADALRRLGGGGPRRNRAQRRRRSGSEPGSHKHPVGATKPLLSERVAKRRKRRRSR